jgi:BirA family biotin operon repressor/biotin-[acetyl-CoA-carboxylase] ligase
MKAGEALRPDALRSSETKRLGKTIHYFAEVDSTNRVAHEEAQRGGEEGAVFVAEGQTQGRGRMGRSWISPPYLNLYFSVILRPDLPPAQVPRITLASAVALAETLESFLEFPPQIKWPNDLLVDGRKVAGILAESSCESGRVRFVILGIGVNLNYPRELMPKGIRGTATSFLTVKERTVDRTAFAVRLIHDLDRCYGELIENGFGSLARRWESFFGFRGKRVRATLTDRSVIGKALGIDSDGALIVEGDGGKREAIAAGEVVPIET